MSVKLTKQECRDIATLLIARSGEAFDAFAFDECNDISEDDKNKILKSLLNICNSMIIKVEKRLMIDVSKSATTKDIIESVIYE